MSGNPVNYNMSTPGQVMSSEMQKKVCIIHMKNLWVFILPCNPGRFEVSQSKKTIVALSPTKSNLPN
jgi:hypothetical protein